MRRWNGWVILAGQVPASVVPGMSDVVFPCPECGTGCAAFLPGKQVGTAAEPAGGRHTVGADIVYGIGADRIVCTIETIVPGRPIGSRYPENPDRSARNTDVPDDEHRQRSDAAGPADMSRLHRAVPRRYIFPEKSSREACKGETGARLVRGCRDDR